MCVGGAPLPCATSCPRVFPLCPNPTPPPAHPCPRRFVRKSRCVDDANPNERKRMRQLLESVAVGASSLLALIDARA